MIYRGSLNDSGNTWSNNVILGNAGSTTVGSDTLGYNGSGVDVFASEATSDNSSFISNTQLYFGLAGGGGISGDEGSTLCVTGGTFYGNQAGGGGAIWAGDSTNVSVINSSFTDNTSSESGGAVEVVQFSVSPTVPSLSVSGSSFVGNQSGFAGGAIDTVGATASVEDTSFSSNQVTGFELSVARGGAISAGANVYPGNQYLPLVVTGCTFIDNQASVSSDALFQTG